MKNRTLPAKSPTTATPAKSPTTAKRTPTAKPPAPVLRHYKLRADTAAAIVLAAAREGLGFDEFVTRAIRRELTSAAAPALA